MSHNWGHFFAFFGPFEAILGVGGQVQKLFLGPTYVNNQLCFWKYSPIFLFLICPHYGPLLNFFWALRDICLPFGFFFGQDQIQNTLLEPTNIDDDFLF